MQHAFLEVQILKDKGKEDSDAKKRELNEVCTISSQNFTQEKREIDSDQGKLIASKRFGDLGPLYMW